MKTAKKLGINEIILKNESDKKTLAKLNSVTNPEVLAESNKLIEDLNRRFGEKQSDDKPKTKRQLKKEKKKAKSFLNTRGINIDYAKVKKLLIAFFAVIIPLAIISGIFLLSLNIKITDYVQNNIEVLYTVRDGDYTGKDLKNITIKKLTESSAKNENYLRYDEFSLMFRADASNLRLGEVSFKIKARGKGNLTLKVTMWDDEKQEKKIVLNEDSGFAIYQNGDVQTFAFAVNHNFTRLSDNSFLKFEVVETRTSGIEEFCIYNLKFKKF